MGGTGSRYYIYRNTSVREILFERQLWSNEDVCETLMLVQFAIFRLAAGLWWLRAYAKPAGMAHFGEISHTARGSLA